MYATMEDLTAYMGKAVADGERLLKRANELIERATLNRVSTDEPVHVEAAKNATCAQVEYWVTLGGDEMDILGSPKMVHVGSFEMQGEMPELAPRAHRFLLNAGLMYRGIMQGTQNSNLARAFFARRF